MARKFFSFNPQTGLVVSTATEDGTAVFKYEQDIEPFADRAARLRNDPDYWARGVKDSFAHAAFVPDVVIMDMLTRFGVNFYAKHDTKRVLQLLETEYKRFKTTDKRLA